METASTLQMNADTHVSQLYDTYHHQLLGYLTRLVHDREVAEDLCQDTFLKAWSRWAQHKSEASAVGWLYRIATNTAYDYARRARHISFLPLIDSEYVDGSSSIDTQLDIRDAVRKALKQLSKVDRLSLVLFAHAGYTTHEISCILGCSNTAVRIRLHRARIRFQQLYLTAQGY